MRMSIPLGSAGFTVYIWTGEEDDLLHIFPVHAWLAITGLLLQHWNRMDLCKITVTINHIINLARETLDLMEMDAAKLEIGCDSIDAIVVEFNIIIGRQMCKINIRITAKINGPCTSRIKSIENK